MRVFRIGCGRQHELPAGSRFLFEIGEERFAVGEAGDIDGHAVRNRPLHVGAAIPQPHRDEEQRERIALHQAEQRLVQKVGLDQRSVEVDVKRLLVHSAAFRAGRSLCRSWIGEEQGCCARRFGRTLERDRVRAQTVLGRHAKTRMRGYVQGT